MKGKWISVQKKCNNVQKYHGPIVLYMSKIDEFF